VNSLQSALKSLSSGDFESLVHAIVAAEACDGMEVRKMRAPDAGADTLVMKPDGTVQTVVQAKAYGQSIHWSQCESSLDRAIEQWGPGEVRFVFLVDFTKNDQIAFKKRLVDRSARSRVTAWTLSDVERLLSTHSTIGPRFLGFDARSVVAAVERAARLGGLTLANATDLVARASEIAKFGDEIDPHFSYGVAAGSPEVPLPVWDQCPAMSVTVTDGAKRVEVTAWPRSPESKQRPTIRFSEDAEGRRSKASVREALAGGKGISFTGGVFLERAVNPKIASEFGEEILWKVEFATPKSVPLDLHCESPHGSLDLHLELRNIPPHGSELNTFASLKDGLWFELNLFEETASTGRIGMYLGSAFGPNASQNLDVARSVLRWMTRTHLRAKSPLLTIDQDLQEPGTVSADVAECIEKIQLFEMTVALETAFQAQFRFPQSPTLRDVEQLRLAHHILTNRKGIAKQEVRTVVLSSFEIPAFSDALNCRRGQRTFPVTVELFNEVLSFGSAHYELPAMRISDIQPLGTYQGSAARVFLTPESDIEWRLIEPLQLRIVAGPGEPPSLV